MKIELKTYVLILLTSLIGSLLGFAIYDQLSSQSRTNQAENNFARSVNLESPYYDDSFERLFRSTSPNDFTQSAESSIDAIVSISGFNKSKSKSNRNISNSSGSGVFISPKGHIVTNYHVIESKEDIQITLNDKRVFNAEVIGFDKATDLAVLKIDITESKYLIFGNSDSLRIGEWVLAIGSPFKLNASVTAGIVSAKARDINIFENNGIESFIQTDAAVNPGNSGGALINTNGELVGINTAILTYSGKYEGFSFAIPANLAKKVVTDIRQYGVVQRAWLGVAILELTDQYAKTLGTKANAGVLVDFVEKAGSAQLVGIKKNDIIAKLENKDVNSIPRFLEILANYSPGDELSVTFLRDNKSITKKVKLRNQLNTTELIAVRKDQVLKKLGLEIRDLSKLEKDRVNQSGVIVISITKGSTVAATNMDPGYVITKINDQSVQSAQQVIDVIKSSDGPIFLEGFYEHYPGKYPYTFRK